MGTSPYSPLDVRARWTGEVFVPTRRPEGLRQGETVALEVSLARSMRSHRHQFAAIREAWAQLPEAVTDRPWAQNAESLRKHALCATGWKDVTEAHWGTAEFAMRAALLEKDRAFAKHGYAIVECDPGRALVRVTVPRSQSLKAMGAADFKRSKSDVLDWCAALVGVSVEALRAAAKGSPAERHEGAA